MKNYTIITQRDAHVRRQERSLSCSGLEKMAFADADVGAADADDESEIKHIPT